MIRALFAVSVLCALVGCGGASTGTATASSTTSAGPAGFPERLFIGSGSGPVLFLGPESGSPALGYASAGVEVRIAGAPEGEHVAVRIDGPLKVRAFVPLRRLEALVQRAGRVRGAPLYLGVNDRVGIVALAADGRIEVEATPLLLHDTMPQLGPFTGTFPARGLGHLTIPAAEVPALPTGTRMMAGPGQALEIYDRPRGRVVATLPALDPPLVVDVLRTRGEWSQLRAGSGPYLYGYSRAPLVPAPPEAPEEDLDIAAGGAPTRAGMPERLLGEAGAAYRVRSGARVRFNGETIAIFAADGYAREMQRYPNGDVDVFAAVDDRIAVRGIVKARYLTSIEAPAAAPAAGEAAPAAPTP